MKIPNPFKPKPAAPAFGTGHVLPEHDASPLSRLVFQWLSPFLDVGFSRPLEKEDLWELPEERLTHSLTGKLEHNFYNRCPPDKRPRFLRGSSQHPSSPPLSPKEEPTTSKNTESQPPGTEDTKPAQTRKRFGKKSKAPTSEHDSSLLRALHTTFWLRWWGAGFLKLLADTLKTTTPLLNKVILTWLTNSYYYYRLTEAERTAAGITQQPKGIGYGIGLAVGLFAMQEVSSLMTNHYMQLSMTNGLFIRTSIIGNIFRKSLRLSGRARLDHSVGQITTMISTDASRFDRFSAFAHNLWVSPIQIFIGIGLLIGNLGYSALVGFGVLLLGFPLQLILVKVMFEQRKKGVKLTDARVRLTTEVLQGIRLLKFYAWEEFYANQITKLREREIRTIRKSAMARSALIALVTLIPVLASILSFITYALSGHDLNIAIIFSSLQFFNIIRAPLLFFPFVLSILSDTLVALGRVSKFLTAEELEDPYLIEYEAKHAVEVDGDFTWETAGKVEESKFNVGAGKGGGPGAGRAKGDSKKEGKKAKAGKKGGKTAGSEKGNVLPTTAGEGSNSGGSDGDGSSSKEEEKPFELKGLKLSIPKGSFVGIVGRVGSGKSSILQALIGEMRRTRGEVVFGGTVAYVPQTAWIRNATLRENILFGQDEDDEKFREIVRACSLEHDLEMLPYGEETEIGEKGINLSGGQKARVSLARAAYSPSDVILLDDPLSAVDAYVGKTILENCFLSGPLASKTRILVTHALHVLDRTDYIYVIENGEIAEQGTYDSLMKDGAAFSRLMDEYGSLEREIQDPTKVRKGDADEKADDTGETKANAALMQVEERATGSVEWSTYAQYLRFAGGIVWAPILLFFLTVMQSAQVGNNLFLGFWTDTSIPGFRQGDYMAVYAGLGVAQALFSFFLSFGFAIASLIASLNLFRTALRSVLRSPVSFFDTTPLGRIMSRLSKDQDTLDNELSLTLNQFLSTFSSVIGTVALVFYTFPLLGIIFAPMTVLYYIVAMYYRRSSVETKRLDSIMRSQLYASYSETLTGLATIRAYREQDRSVRDAEHGLDMENRAYYMTISIQRWLAVRLDLFGNILIFGIALFAAGFRRTVNPSKIGVVLSYTLSITQIFSEMVSQFAQNEQNMNAVERLLVYSDLPPEAALTTPDDPPPTWPDKGDIKFTNVELRYREGLPLVLKDISFQINAGEKIGIVGRTGAGKSSLLQALFRVAEVDSGKIEIDGINTRNIGLDALRGRLALVPQDSTMFLGTLRENLDPQNSRTDAELISVLQRAWLLPPDGTTDPVAEAKFSLDSTVGDEGANFSAGEKQLLALCRALVKNSRIIILDEATSSVDVETDSKLQQTIQIEFATSTLLCIAHRLNTIAYYDRVIVMDSGRIAEFDTVLNLYDKADSIFRSLCDEANLKREDILRIRQHHNEVVRQAPSV